MRKIMQEVEQPAPKPASLSLVVQKLADQQREEERVAAEKKRQDEIEYGIRCKFMSPLRDAVNELAAAGAHFFVDTQRRNIPWFPAGMAEWGVPAERGMEYRLKATRVAGELKVQLGRFDCPSTVSMEKALEMFADQLMAWKVKFNDLEKLNG